MIMPVFFTLVNDKEGSEEIREWADEDEGMGTRNFLCITSPPPPLDPTSYSVARGQYCEIHACSTFPSNEKIKNFGHNSSVASN
jgi:hypothetical protein